MIANSLLKIAPSLITLTALTGAAGAAISSTGLEVYYSFDSGSVTSTVVTDQWTTDGNADNVGRTALSTFSTGAKFGDAINVTTSASTPRATTIDAATINASFLPGTGDYTLTFWYRQGATGSNRIFQAGARGSDANQDDGLQLYMLGASGFEVACHDPSLGTTTRDIFTTGAAGTFNGTAWNHFALVRNNTTLALWVNGTQIGSKTLTSGYNIAVGSATFNREATFGPDANVAGAAYDDTAVFKRALSNLELQQIWNGGTGATIASLVPEPSSALLSGLGVLALLRRRR